MFFGTDEFSLAHLQVLHKSMQDENEKLVEKLEVTVADQKVSNNLPIPFKVAAKFLFYQWRIQDFPEGGGEAPTPKVVVLTYYYIAKLFAENCMKMKEL